MPSRSIYHLAWVSLTLDVGYLFTAAPVKHGCCSLPWNRGIFSCPPFLVAHIANLNFLFSDPDFYSFYKIQVKDHFYRAFPQLGKVSKIINIVAMMVTLSLLLWIIHYIIWIICCCNTRYDHLKQTFIIPQFLWCRT